MGRGAVIHSGANLIDGVPVEVIRKRIRCINIRVKADGTVVLSIPKWWSTLRQGEVEGDLESTGGGSVASGGAACAGDG